MKLELIKMIFRVLVEKRKFSPVDRSLRRELKSTFGNNNYWFNTSKFKNAVEDQN